MMENEENDNWREKWEEHLRQSDAERMKDYEEDMKKRLKYGVGMVILSEHLKGEAIIVSMN